MGAATKLADLRAQTAFAGQMVAFGLANAVNGGLVGAAGPSMHEIGVMTGMSSAELGTTVMLNRVAKLGGSFIWMAYARSIEDGRAIAQPRLMLAAASATCSMCALLLATHRTSEAVLRGALIAAGLAYGFSDSGMTLLTVWANRLPSQQRTQVALLNLGFTVGALLSPAAIATALHMGGTVYVGFYTVGGLGALTTFFYLVCERLPCLSPPAAISRGSEREGVADMDGSTSPGRRTPPPGASLVYPAGACLGERIVILTMTAVLFCVTGCEHAMATWLPSFGHHVGGIEHSEMAVMSAAFWSTICFGRLLWAAISPKLTSGFPALAFDGALMLLSALLIADFGRRALVATLGGARNSLQLWVGTVGLGFGCSSSLPCAITLPAEAKVELTPLRLLVLNLAGSAGETLLPFLIGLAFEQRRYSVLGSALVLMELFVVSCTAAAWRAARMRAAVHAAAYATPFEQATFPNSCEEDLEQEERFNLLGDGDSKRQGHPRM